jgi:hypothetical protein
MEAVPLGSWTPPHTTKLPGFLFRTTCYRQKDCHLWQQQVDVVVCRDGWQVEIGHSPPEPEAWEMNRRPRFFYAANFGSNPVALVRVLVRMTMLAGLAGRALIMRDDLVSFGDHTVDPTAMDATTRRVRSLLSHKSEKTLRQRGRIMVATNAFCGLQPGSLPGGLERSVKGLLR